MSPTTATEEAIFRLVDEPVDEGRALELMVQWKNGGLEAIKRYYASHLHKLGESPRTVAVIDWSQVESAVREVEQLFDEQLITDPEVERDFYAIQERARAGLPSFGLLTLC